MEEHPYRNKRWEDGIGRFLKGWGEPDKGITLEI